MNVNKATPNIPVESGFHIIHQQENQCAMLCYINWCKLYYLFLSWLDANRTRGHITSIFLLGWLAQKAAPQFAFCSLCPPNYFTQSSNNISTSHWMSHTVATKLQSNITPAPPKKKSKTWVPLKAIERKRKLPEFHVSIYFFCFAVHTQKHQI